MSLNCTSPTLSVQDVDAEVVLPRGVGPHEGIEFALMQAGKKHVAYFQVLSKAQSDDFLNAGYLVLHWINALGTNCPYHCWIVFREGHEGTALRLKTLISNPPKGFVDAHEYEVGRILGYEDWQIAAFLAHATRDRVPKP